MFIYTESYSYISSATLYSNVIIVKWKPMQHDQSLGLCTASAVARWGSLYKIKRKLGKTLICKQMRFDQLNFNRQSKADYWGWG